jgi:hypothetical protein
MSVWNLFRTEVSTNIDAGRLRKRVFRRSPAVVWVTHYDETVVYNLERGTYETLNQVASTAWQRIVSDSGATLDTIIESVRAEYHLPAGVPADQLERDIAGLLVKLQNIRAVVSDAAI